MNKQTFKPNVDLAASFDRLKRQLIQAKSTIQAEQTPENYARSFGYLSGAVSSHLLKCTGGKWDDLNPNNNPENDSQQTPIYGYCAD